MELVRTAGRSAIALLAGAILGAASGLLFGAKAGLYAWFEPLVEVLRPVPAVALLPIFLLVVPSGDVAVIGSAAWAVFFLALVNTLYSAYAIDSVRVAVFRSYRASSRLRLTKLLIPSAVPSLIATARVGLNVALLVTVAAELAYGDGGIGSLIRRAQQNFRFDEMYAAVIALALVAVVLNLVLRRAERSIFRRMSIETEQ